MKVGLLGSLLMRNDGTLTPGDGCMPGMYGITTAAQEGYRY